LHSDRKDEVTPNSKESYSYILGTIAVFILLMACANFVNVSTATLVSRFKEISIQKVLGASKLHLVLYFWIESSLMCIVALVVAYLLALLALPYFSQVTGKYISLLDNLWLITPSLLLTLFIGLLSSIVPTIQAATLNVLKIGKSYGESLGKSTIRTILITFQFAISILLITATWIVSSQFSFLKSSRFGFASDNVITIPVKDRSQNDRHQTISKKIGELTGVEKVSYSSSMPGANNAYTYTYSFMGTDVGEQTMAAFLVDEFFFELYEIKLKEGRLPNIESKDTVTEVVLNEAAVEQFHLSSPIGQLVTGQVKGKVVGIIENFNYASLHSSIEPMILYSYPANFRFVSIKLNQGSFQNVISSLDKKWQELYPGYPLEYTFLNETIQKLYGAEFQLSKAYTVFSLIAVIIAGVGLIGLATYLLTRKLKEISIRKVFGSSVGRIVLWIYSGYLKIIIIASVVAWGVGYYVMQNWLDGFAFKTNLEVYYFVIPPLIMTLLLLVATGFQSLKAAGTNPVENLRNE
ncbi:MAG TPA: FtsX-like permease family protein, partial [Cyclobacteriaceae bacterium]|nr:FtsX-like permease family protein [Cyclobacteriaceae bacterium]